ncbi:MAG: HAD-IC family P-type ATPase [Candidatus Kapabacteria bacterium]|nr:HAD-IC family P-type ATPase [Candidatus Kapabacteria bacterium]
MSWHTFDLSEIYKKFDVNPEIGLNEEKVNKNRKEFGENIILSKKPKPDWVLFLEQFNNPIIYILIVAAIINALVSDLKDTIVIAAVIILNTVIGFIQERRASDALKVLSKMAAPVARVIRNGVQSSIPTEEVVCGDIIILESGMRVPADARLIESNNLTVDESMLTGESFPVEKKPDAKISESAPIGDRFNYIYSGTIIVKGRATAVVTSVGNHTEFGKISEKVAEAEDSVSPLQHQIEKFSKGLSIAILGAVLLIFVIGLVRDNSLITMFLTSVGLAVSAIPEGLPVAVTITLSIGISQMAKHKAIVKKLSAVETLGSTNFICTDKTGTLTKNQMIVTKLFTSGDDYYVSGSGYNIYGVIFNSLTGEEIKYDYNKAIELIVYNSYLCSESKLIQVENEEWKFIGDPTEVALMIMSKKAGLEDLQASVNVDIPFESENQLMAVRANFNGKNYIFAKGAPEKIIARCQFEIKKDGTIEELDVELINKKIAEFSAWGLRVIALAYNENHQNEILDLDTLNGLIFLGFAGIEDSVRPEAVEAVNQCHNAGIKVVMITGDHIKTAQTVAKSVGIGEKKDSPVGVTGIELDKMSDSELFKRVPEIDVYARVAPHHKFRIVKQLQAHKNIVAMTGDGVNDAPALKQADIGVAMGSGTDVAREAADMVLMDDNFATIVQAVRRGRIILHNLQHILLYILSTSFGGLLTIAVSVTIGLPLPLLPAQLLWVNLVTDGTSTFPLAFEKEHGDVMAFPPRKKDRPLITKRMIFRIFASGVIMMIGTLLVFAYSVPDIFNMTPDEHLRAKTMAFCMLAFFQIWNVQNSRSVDRSLFFNLPFTKGHTLDRISPAKNLPLLGVMILAILLQVSAVTLPFMNVVLNTVPLSLEDWILVLGSSFSIIIFVEISKFITAVINKRKRSLGLMDEMHL